MASATTAAALTVSLVASEVQLAKCNDLRNYNIVFIVERNTNNNIVCYEANVVDGALVPSDPIHVYWQDIDDDYIRKDRAKGKLHSRSELNFIESKMAYGISSAPLGSGRYSLTLVALPSKQVELKMVEMRSPTGEIIKVAKAISQVNGRTVYVTKIFVEAKSSMFGPKVLHVIISGVDIENGSIQAETITP